MKIINSLIVFILFSCFIVSCGTKTPQAPTKSQFKGEKLSLQYLPKEPIQVKNVIITNEDSVHMLIDSKTDSLINEMATNNMNAYDITSDFGDIFKKKNPPSSPTNANPVLNSGLPAYFTNRQFLSNGTIFADHPEKLIGYVILQDPNNKDQFTIVDDFKYDTNKLKVENPNLDLVDRQWDWKAGLSVSSLIPSVNLSAGHSCEFIISDAYEVAIDEPNLNLDLLYNTLSTDKDSITEYLVIGAITSNIIYKTYDSTKVDAKAQFSAALKINGNFYTNSTSFGEDRKVGCQTIPIIDVFKYYRGMKKMKNSSNKRT